MVVFVSSGIRPGIYLGICSRTCPEICLEICHVGKNALKNHDLSEFLSNPPLGGGPDVNSGRLCTLIHSLPCRTPYRFFIHELSFGPLGLHLLV